MRFSNSTKYYRMWRKLWKLIKRCDMKPGRKSSTYGVEKRYHAPYGVDNHIYNTPVDLMHTFLCGIIKSI